jgi:hypothetical protein
LNAFQQLLLQPQHQSDMMQLLRIPWLFLLCKQCKYRQCPHKIQQLFQEIELLSWAIFLIQIIKKESLSTSLPEVEVAQSKQETRTQFLVPSAKCKEFRT